MRKLNVVAQNNLAGQGNHDRKKLDMDSADPQNRSEWRGGLRGRLVKKPNPW